MALAKLTCGACGAPLSLQDTVCPKCKTHVVLPGGTEFTAGAGRAASGERNAGPGRVAGAKGIAGAGQAGEAGRDAPACPVCGHKNSPTTVYCESCGAGLLPSGARKMVMKGEGGPPRGAARRSQASQVRDVPRKDPWPYVALVAIVTLVAVVVYTQWDRTPASSGPPQVTQVTATPETVDPAALLRLEQAVESDPNDEQSLLHLANLLQDNRQFARAVDHYTRYLALRPKDADARVDMGICLYQMGLADSARAVSLFTTAIREMRTAYAETPGHQPAAFNIGIVYLQLGNLDSSNAWFKRTAAINKSSDLGTRAQRILEQHLNAK